MQSQNACLSLGIDIGSTTIKYALIDGNKKIVAARYERHKGGSNTQMAFIGFDCAL